MQLAFCTALGCTILVGHWPPPPQNSSHRTHTAHNAQPPMQTQIPHHATPGQPTSLDGNFDLILDHFWRISQFTPHALCAIICLVPMPNGC